MLSYLILTTRAILMAAVITGVIRGYTKLAADKYQRNIVLVFACVGLAGSALIAWLRNATSLVDSAILNGYIYAFSLVSFVLYLIFQRKTFAESESKLLRTLPWVLLGIITATIILYAMPEVWGYPYHVYLSESTVISTDFLLSMIGLIFGVILSVVAYLGTAKSTVRLRNGQALALLDAELVLNAALRISGLYSVLFQKKIIKSNHTLFTYTVFVKNLFIFLALTLAVVAAVILWVQSFSQKEPYNNPAEHRKIRAKWRSIRRWATTVIICAILGGLNLTVVEKLNATDVTLSPIEDATAVDDEYVYVGFDLVNDGHLHRFAYQSENGVQIRFIVIQKSGNSYGIGLDACDVCGETGYYEKNGQVVCNLCDVVMNISTIGFKGGCNPIVIPYEIANGQIKVPISGLLEYEREFK